MQIESGKLSTLLLEKDDEGDRKDTNPPFIFTQPGLAEVREETEDLVGLSKASLVESVTTLFPQNQLSLPSTTLCSQRSSSAACCRKHTAHRHAPFPVCILKKDPGLALPQPPCSTAAAINPIGSPHSPRQPPSLKNFTDKSPMNFACCKYHGASHYSTAGHSGTQLVCIINWG